MKRGDVVLVRGRVGAVTKARPCVIVQRTAALAGATKVTACPLSSTMVPDNPIRPPIEPTPANGLRRISQVEVDWIFTESVGAIGPTIGTVSEVEMRAIGHAIRLWLDL